MLKAIINFFTGKASPAISAPAVSPESAPYKIEPPVPVTVVTDPAPVKAEKKPAVKAKAVTQAKKTTAKKAPVKKKTTK